MLSHSHLPPWLRVLAQSIDVSVGLLGAIMTIVVFGNVILRAVANFDLAWSLEIVTFLMLWATFLGCASAAARGAHMRVTEIARFIVPARFFAQLERVIHLIVAAVLVSIVWYGFKIALRTWDQETSILYWPVGLLYLSMPVGLLLTLIFVLHGAVTGIYPHDDVMEPTP